MNSIRVLIDTVAVAVGNLLNFAPTGWTASQQEAIRMRAQSEATKNRTGTVVEIVHLDDSVQRVSDTGTYSPIQYLLKSVVNAGVNLCFVYVGWMVLQAFLGAVMLLIASAVVITGVVHLLAWLSPDKSVPVPAV